MVKIKAHLWEYYDIDLDDIVANKELRDLIEESLIKQYDEGYTDGSYEAHKEYGN